MAESAAKLHQKLSPSGKDHLVCGANTMSTPNAEAEE